MNITSNFGRNKYARFVFEFDEKYIFNYMEHFLKQLEPFCHCMMLKV